MSADSKEEETIKNLESIYPYAFEKELIEKQNKHVYLYNTFRANKRVPPITTKFYSKHEDNFEDSKHLERFEHVFKSRMEKNNVPKSENQVYGWLPKSLEGKFKPTDLNTICAPKIRCDLTIFQEKL